MIRIFYECHVPDDPLLGPLFANMAPDHPERVAAWLSEVFGGPALCSKRYGGYAHMIREHLGKRISRQQRQRWVTLLARSADEAGLPEDAGFRAAFVSYLEWGSRLALENSQEGATPPLQMPMPRWSWVSDAYPDSRIAATDTAYDEAAKHPDVALIIPDEGDKIVFELHIRPLFREKDRQSMRFVFDLWDEADVRQHGASIAERLEAGTMPCDGRCPPAHVALLIRWLLRTDNKQA